MTTAWGWLFLEERVGVKDMAGWLFFRPFLGSDMQAFAKQVSDHSKSDFNCTISADKVDIAYSVALYEVILLYAHAATKMMLEERDLDSGQAVTEAVRNTSFVGIGGNTVALDKKGDRIESYQVMNIVVDMESTISSVPVGLYNSTLQQYKAYEQAVVWPGKTVEIPADYFSGECRCMDCHRQLVCNGL